MRRLLSSAASAAMHAQPAPRRVLIVGGGLTGSSLAAQLPRELLRRATVLEKSGSPGRVAVSLPRGAAKGSAAADLGAQYFTAYDARSAAELEALEARGIVARMPRDSISGARAGSDAHAHYVARSGGTARVVDDHFMRSAEEAGASVRRHTRLEALFKERGRWRAVLAPGEKGGAAAAAPAAEDDLFFDAVVLTIPAPQVLQLGGDVPAALAASGAAARLASVAYSSRLVLALYLPPSAAALWAACPWVGRFVARDEPGGAVVRYLSFESRKRRLGGDEDGEGGEGGGGDARAGEDCIAFVAHSTVEFGALHENTPDFQAALAPQLVEAACAALAHAAGLPALPAAPVETRLHRWKYSQVVPSSEIKGGEGDEAGAIAVSTEPLLILAGDYVTTSNLAGCLRSAAAAAALIGPSP